MSEPLKVDPALLHQAAESVDEHAEDFATAHQAAHTQAGRARLGSGAAAGALRQMLAAWQTSGTEFEQRHTSLADDHRQAANAYVRVDTSQAETIDTTIDTPDSPGSAL